MDIKFKAVTFVENGDILHGHYFYEITLPEALERMAEKGLDPIANKNLAIAVYFW